MEARLKGREDKAKDRMHREFWPDLDANQVLSALQEIEVEWDVSAGLMRPPDRLDELFTPPATKNPLRWLEYQTHASDGLMEVSYRLSRRLKENGMETEWGGKVFTVDDFVRAWCGVQKPA